MAPIWVILLVLSGGVSWASQEFEHSAQVILPPPLSSLLKEKQWKGITQERDVISYARLEDLSGDLRKYSFYSAMVVRAELKLTREVLTDYKVYSEFIPFIEKTAYNPQTKILELEGGIWHYKLKSSILFVETADRWIHYQIRSGHFQGLQGDIFFESLGEKGTAVFLRGELKGNHWPPRFVIERGAEVVFGVTGQRMRSLIEARKKPPKEVPKGENHEQQKGQSIPQPKSHL